MKTLWAVFPMVPPESFALRLRLGWLRRLLWRGLGVRFAPDRDDPHR